MQPLASFPSRKNRNSSKATRHEHAKLTEYFQSTKKTAPNHIRQDKFHFARGMLTHRTLKRNGGRQLRPSERQSSCRFRIPVRQDAKNDTSLYRLLFSRPHCSIFPQLYEDLRILCIRRQYAFCIMKTRPLCYTYC
jgi:hypothetical protein